MEGRAREILTVLTAIMIAIANGVEISFSPTIIHPRETRNVIVACHHGPTNALDVQAMYITKDGLGTLAEVTRDHGPTVVMQDLEHSAYADGSLEETTHSYLMLTYHNNVSAETAGKYYCRAKYVDSNVPDSSASSHLILHEAHDEL